MGSQNTIWRIVILALMCYALLSLASTGRELYAAEAYLQELEAGYAMLQEENMRLRELAETGCDDEQIRLLARQRLGLVMPGEIIFYFEK